MSVDIFEAVQNSWENLSLDDDFCKVNGVLGDLGEALAHVTLELGIGVGDKCSEVGNGSLVDDGLGKFLSMFGDLGESGGGDALEGQLWLLNAEDKETNGTSVNNSLGELMVVLCDA